MKTYMKKPGNKDKLFTVLGQLSPVYPLWIRIIIYVIFTNWLRPFNANFGFNKRTFVQFRLENQLLLFFLSLLWTSIRDS
jgi:hypothetical protein